MSFLIIAITFVLLFLPQIWAKKTIRNYNHNREDIPGTGNQFAHHLLDKLKISDCSVRLDSAGIGDHYDPIEKVVSLSEENYNQNSLSALVIASHEVGHALQDRLNYKPLKVRTRLAKFAHLAEKMASIFLFASPLITFLTKMPFVGAIIFLSAFGVMALPVVIHILTLPVELDASFNRALPILSSGYLESEDIIKARKILLACSFTYLAASLAGLLNLWRWIRLLRR